LDEMRVSFDFSTERDEPCGRMFVVDCNEIVLVNKRKRRRRKTWICIVRR